MDTALTSMGYEFGASKYSPGVGYSRLKLIISGQPTQRYFDIKLLRIPTFDGRFYHQTQVTRHELSLEETFQVCPGQISMETHRGESLRAFSFGGSLQAIVRENEVNCDLTSSAPIFKLREDPKLVGAVIVDELMDLLAEQQARLSGHEDELYSRLAKFEPYQIFLAGIVSLQKRADSVPTNLRREKYRQTVGAIQRAVQIVRATDGWDGKSPSLEELLRS